MLASVWEYVTTVRPNPQQNSRNREKANFKASLRNRREEWKRSHALYRYLCENRYIEILD
ncbi:MAG: hypothetical protein AB1861_26320 [Cyanobacteriota bacterium]